MNVSPLTPTVTILADGHSRLLAELKLADFQSVCPYLMPVCPYLMRDSDRSFVEKITQIVSEIFVCYQVSLTDGNLMIAGKEIKNTNPSPWCFHYKLANTTPLKDAKPIEFAPSNFVIIEEWYKKDGMANSIRKEKISEQDYIQIEQIQEQEKKE